MKAELLVLPAVVLATFAACGSNESNARIERCVDRLLSRAEVSVGDEEAARDYARRTYCERFESNGWIYDDGVLRIGAQEWLDEGGRCAVARAGEPTRNVPCDVVEDRGHFNCALLHHVRRTEVRAYVARRSIVACDDGTPVDELGVP